MRTKEEGDGRSRKGWSITIPVGKLLFHITEKLHEGTLRCFKKYRVSKCFMHRRGVS